LCTEDKQLAPLWVLPEYQGRGVSSLLLKETINLADAEDPPTALYLESMPEARKVYEHFGFEGLPGYDMQMVRGNTLKKDS
jgi:GNAT superfamily N-acetyltransferase